MIERLTLSCLVFAVSASIGCSAAGDGGLDIAGPLTLTPEGIPAELVQSVADRWIAASGLPIVVGPGGTSVRKAPLLPQRCGETGISIRMPARVAWIEIAQGMDPRCGGEEVALLHEVGHAVCERGLSHELSDMCHTAQEAGRLMAPGISSSCIDAESLAKVCTHQNCTTFNPEC